LYEYEYGVLYLFTYWVRGLGLGLGKRKGNCRIYIHGWSLWDYGINTRDTYSLRAVISFT
jgi:hypothetical protein